MLGQSDENYDNDHLQQAARDHLWMHFTRHSTYDHADVPVIVRGEGPYIFDAVGSPPAQLGWDGAQFTCFPSTGTSTGTVVVQGAADGVQHWRATVFGALPDSLPAPLFPADWGWDDAPATGVVVRAWTTVLDADTNYLSFDNFHALVRVTAENATLIE